MISVHVIDREETAMIVQRLDMGIGWAETILATTDIGRESIRVDLHDDTGVFDHYVFWEGRFQSYVNILFHCHQSGKEIPAWLNQLPLRRQRMQQRTPLHR